MASMLPCMQTGRAESCLADADGWKASLTTFAKYPVPSISASLTACLLRGYGRAGTQNDRLSEAVILSTGTPIPAHQTSRRRCRDRAIFRCRDRASVSATTHMCRRLSQAHVP